MLHFVALLSLAIVLFADPALVNAASQRINCEGRTDGMEWQFIIIENYHVDTNLIFDCEIVDLAGTLATFELTYPNATQLLVNPGQYCRVSKIGTDESPAFRSIVWLLQQIPKEAIMEIAKNLGAGAHYGCLGVKYKYENLVLQPYHAHYNLVCLYRKRTGKEEC